MEEEMHCFHTQYFIPFSRNILFTKQHNIKTQKWKYNKDETPQSLISHSHRLSPKTQSNGEEMEIVRNLLFQPKCAYSSKEENSNYINEAALTCRHIPLKLLKSYSYVAQPISIVLV